MFWEPIWDVCWAGRNTNAFRKGKIFESERDRIFKRIPNEERERERESQKGLELDGKE